MLAELLRARAAAAPDGIAFVVAGGGALSFSAWDRRSDAVAAGLRRRSLGSGDRVVLRFDTAAFVELAVAAAGVQKAGAISVPLPAHASVVELDRVVRHSVAAMVLGPAALGEVEDEGGSGGPAPDAPPGELAEISYRLGPLRPALPTAHRATDVLGAGAALSDGPSVPSMLHASAVGTAVARGALWFPLGPGRGPVVTVPGADPEEVCGLTAAHRVTRWVLDPLVAAFVLDTGAANRHDLSSLAQIVLAGGPSRASLLSRLTARFPGVAIVPVGDDEREPPSMEEGPEVAPVAASQEGMLWQEQLVPGSQNLPPLARRYRGPLDLDVLGGALTELVRRHEPLRTTFALADGEPVQVVAPPRAVVPEIRDLQGRTPADQADEVAGFLDRARRPLDLVDGPLFEPTVFRLGPDDHVVVFRVHHSVYDDWSVGVFRRELSTLYPALAAGERAPLPDLPVSFRDFARAQRRPHA
ncbi:MAG TPA: condensation domain-containing protein, partial [Acidimicrobiales bacterium]|nr:condensation domain-containing protein [Acidimicrobiales bacterium]